MINPIHTVSLSQLSRVLGVFLSGLMADKLGRRRSLIVSSILQLLAAFGVYFCTSFLSLAAVLAITTFFSSMVQVEIFRIDILCSRTME